jgi:hypothetical protein
MIQIQKIDKSSLDVDFPICRSRVHGRNIPTKFPRGAEQHGAPPCLAILMTGPNDDPFVRSFDTKAL